MFKFLFRVILFLVILVVAINLGGHLLLDQVIEQTMQVPAKVGRVKLDVINMEGGIYGIKLYNPEGFSKEAFATIPELSVKLNFGAMFKRQIHIPEMKIAIEEVAIQRNQQGQINLMELEPVKEAAKSAAEERKQKEDGEAQSSEPLFSLQVDRVVLSLGNGSFQDFSGVQPTKQVFSLNIRDRVLENVTSIDEMIRLIVLEIMRKMGLNALIPNWAQLSASFEMQASAVLENLKEGFQNFKKKIESGFNKQSDDTK